MTALKPLPKNQFDYWKAHHLLSRAGFGGAPAEVRALAEKGLDDAVDHLVDYRRIEFEPVEADLFDRNIMQPLTPGQRQDLQQARESGNERVLEQYRRQRQERQRADRKQIREMQTWWLKRMIDTRRPLEEKLTLFWHGHFATSYRAIEDSYHMFLQNQLFRAHAAGDFAALVQGVVRDPAMLEYLNNNQNRRERPNENLARELMELFVLGEGHGYTEQDIKEAARALTGNTFQDDEFIFRAQWHDDEPKRILGQVGNWDAADLCDISLSRKAASEFICLKLYRYFVNDAPGEPTGEARRFIQALAGRLRARDYALRPVLETMFKSAHFHEAQNVASVIKSPIQLIVQAVRSMGTPARDLRTLIDAADRMGQNLFFPPSVKGWDGGRAWINTSTLFVRQNAIIHLLTGRLPAGYRGQSEASSCDLTHLVTHLRTEGEGADVQAAVTYLLRFMLGTEPRAERVKACVDFVNEHGGDLDNNMLIGLASLIAAMPEYQLC